MRYGLWVLLGVAYGCVTLDSHWYRERIKMQIWRSRQKIEIAISKLQTDLSLPADALNNIVLSCKNAVDEIEAELVLFNILSVDYIDPANPLVKR